MDEPKVFLSIKKGNTAPSGYTQATNGDGQKIPKTFYKFTGGTDGNGNVEVDTQGKKTRIIIKLAPDGTRGKYDVVTAMWKSEPQGKLKVVIPGPNRLRIINEATVPEDIQYTVIVAAENSSALILCDPRISNRW